MARSINASTLTELQASSLRPAFLLDIAFQSGTVYFTTAPYNLTYNSQTYQANGYIVNIGELEDAQARFWVELSGAASSLISAVLNNGNYAAPVNFYFATLSAAGAIVGAPILTFKGVFDNAELEGGGNSAITKLYFVSDFDDLERGFENRYTKECQERFVPGDLGFDYVNSLQDWTGVWGKPGRRNAGKKKRRPDA